MATRDSQEVQLVAIGGPGNVLDSQEVMLVAVPSGGVVLDSQEVMLVAMQTVPASVAQPIVFVCT